MNNDNRSTKKCDVIEFLLLDSIRWGIVHSHFNILNERLSMSLCLDFDLIVRLAPN